MKKSEFLEVTKEFVISGKTGICVALHSAFIGLGVRKYDENVVVRDWLLQEMETDRLRIEAIAKFGASQQDVKEGWFWWSLYDRSRLEFLDWWIKDLKSRGE